MQFQKGDSEGRHLEVRSHVDVHQLVPLEDVRVQDRLRGYQPVAKEQVVETAL